MIKVLLTVLLSLPLLVLAGTPEKNFSPAVNSLWIKAINYYNKEEFEKAANTIERALGIDHNNAYLWHGLAGVRFAQENWKRAAHLAKKSLTLAKKDKALQTKNRWMITQTCQKMGRKYCAPPKRTISPTSHFRDPHHLYQLAAKLLKKEKWARARLLALRSLQLAKKTKTNRLQIKNWILITKACESLEKWGCARHARNQAQFFLQP
ncbi:MAG: hypothetical protein KAH77_12185 [Thiomargarita sp.]|nr:hypothetical protein [Thiomargarita sp.]